MESPHRQPNLIPESARTAAGLLRGDRPGVTGAEPDQRFAMYELISIPKRNTTAAGVTHFMFKFLVLISHLGPAISKADWLAWQGRASANSLFGAVKLAVKLCGPEQ